MQNTSDQDSPMQIDITTNRLIKQEDKRAIVILVIIYGLAFALLFKPWVHGFDPTGYYAYLHSVVINHDLHMMDEFAHYGFAGSVNTTVTGYAANPYGIGSAILWAPSYLAAHALSALGSKIGRPLVPDGYSQIYVFAVGLSSSLYALCGIALTNKLIRRYMEAQIALVATVATWLSSTLVFYQFSHPLMSHANDFFAYALYLTVWARTHRLPSLGNTMLLGAVTALAALVRTQNALLVLLPLVEIVVSALWEPGDSRRQAILGGLLRGTVFSLAWWAIFSPQLFVWRTVFGQWIPGNTYTPNNGGRFDFLHPHFFGVLFSTNSGLFSWTPLILPAVLGWVLLWRNNRRLTALLTLNFVLQVYVIAAWSSWSGSAAFGQRFFSNQLTAFALGLAALLAHLRKWIKMKTLIAACALFVVWNGLLIVRYALEDVSRCGPIPISQLIIGQFTILPRCFGRILEIIVTRQ